MFKIKLPESSVAGEDLLPDSWMAIIQYALTWWKGQGTSLGAPLERH